MLHSCEAYPHLVHRTGHIRWGVVAVRLLEIAAIIFYISFLCERFLLGNFSNFGKPNEVLEAKQLVLSLFGSMMPALLTYLCGFYLLLHSWLNATSEVLTFADRQFYMVSDTSSLGNDKKLLWTKVCRIKT